MHVLLRVGSRRCHWEELVELPCGAGQSGLPQWCPAHVGRVPTSGLCGWEESIGGSAWGPGVSTELPEAPRLSRDQGWMWPGPGLLWDMVTAI